MAYTKPNRVRDPVHNLIEFGQTTDSSQREIEQALWRVIQTPPFQRLRRIKQLGFSEFVFPGATHTRFSHSLGVFHTARLLLSSVQRSLAGGRGDYSPSQARIALAAALVHDVGHGMFSHAFEAVGEELNLDLARHEKVSDKLIRESEIKDVLDSALGEGFSNSVADLIGREQPKTLYDAIVTSQFDADRLDYMQRDQLMTGVHGGAVDITWLLENLEISEVETASDEEKVGTIQTLVLGPKAFHVAESYVLSLFHLYPNVYFHKATRGAEQVLRKLIIRIYELVNKDSYQKTGLPINHPLVVFSKKPDVLKHVLDLDDAVLWGAIPMMVEAEDQVIRNRASQLLNRRLLRCIDLWEEVQAKIEPVWREDSMARKERIARINLACNRIIERANELPSVIFDNYVRDPYKRLQGSRTPTNQIYIIQGGRPRDMAELSAVVAGAEPFRVCRAYIERDDKDTQDRLSKIIEESFTQRNSLDE